MEEKIKKLVELLKAYGAKKIKLFGSYARGDWSSNSDLDVIVEFEDVKSLLELIKIEQELEEALNVKVDLLTEESVSPYLKKNIKRDEKVLL
jgi:hypothetical protein